MKENQSSLWENLKIRIFLGDEQFEERMLALVEKIDAYIKYRERIGGCKSRSIEDHIRDSDSSDMASESAYRSGQLLFVQIGDYFDLHYSTVGEIVRNYER